MKKIITFIYICLLGLILTACANQNQRSAQTVNQSPGVEEVLLQGIAAADEAILMSTPTALAAPTPELSVQSISSLAENVTEGVDIDLTKLSSTMIYAEVYAMMTNSNEYIGKTIRMSGTNSYFYDRNTDTYYYACLIKDATACCAQGIEFVLSDDYILPYDYPEQGAEITVTGVFNSYQEKQFTFYHLTDAVLSN